MNLLVKAIQFENLNVNDVIAFLKSHEKTQIVNEKCVFGEKHIHHCVSQTLKAFANKENIAKNASLDLLLKLAGVRQIEKAIKVCKPAKRSVFVCWEKDAKNIFDEFKKKFSFKEVSLRTVSDNEMKDAIEKSAMFWLS